MAEAFIKLHRKMTEWEWYKDTNTFVLFIHCLLIANWKDGRFMGQIIPRGSFVSSYAQLAEQTNLSVQNVRTAINHLKLTGELTVKSHTKFSVFTVNNYCQYQDDNRQPNKQLTDNQQTTNKQLTTIEEYKEKKEEKEVKNIYGEYRHVRLTQKEHDRLVNDFGEGETHEAIKFLDEYKEMKGYKCKNDNLAMRKWVFNAVKEEKQRKGETDARVGTDTSRDEAEYERQVREQLKRIESGEFDNENLWE